MNGFQLTFFTLQDRTHEGQPVHRWLMEAARSLNIRGVTIIAAQEGLGTGRRVHSARFFELADQPIEVSMVVSEAECDAMMALLHSQTDIRLFYTKVPLEFGRIGSEAA